MRTPVNADSCRAKSMSRSLLLTALLTLLAAPCARAHSPHDVITAVATTSRSVFAIIDSNILIRSPDAGASWAELAYGFDNRHPITAIDAIEHGEATWVVAGTDGDGVFASVDGGDTWQRLPAVPGSGRIKSTLLADAGYLAVITYEGKLYDSTDFGTHWRLTDAGDAHITAAALVSPRRLAVGTDDGRILTTALDETQWSSATVPAELGAINDLIATSGDEPVVLAATAAAGVVRSTDGGATFEAAATGPTDPHARALATDPITATTLAVTWHDGGYRSDDAGKTWRAMAAGLTTDTQADDPVHLSPHFIDVDVAAAPGGSIWFVGAFDGIFHSRSQDAQWLEIQTLLPGRIMDLAVSPQGPQGHCVALSTYGGGAYRRCSDTGRWQVLNRGLTNTRLTGMTFAQTATDASVLFAGAPGQLLSFSDDNGGGWHTTPLNRGMWNELLLRGTRFLNNRLGLPASWTIDLLGKDVQQPPFPEALSAAATFKSDGDIYFSTRRHGLMRASAESGETTVLRASERLLGAVLMSPDFAADRTLFVSARHEGVLVSRDGGERWSSANEGLDFLDAWHAMADEPGRHHEVERSKAFQIELASSPEFARDGTLFAATSLGLYRSTDRGETWVESSNGLPGTTPYTASVAVSPNYEQDRTVLVAVTGHGIFRSRNAADTFEPLFTDARFARIHRLQFSPDFATDRTVYAASPLDAFESHDGGATWRSSDRPVRDEGTRGVIVFEGDWKQRSNPRLSASNAWTASASGSALELSFVGTGLDVLGKLAPGARLTVHLDDAPLDDVVGGADADGPISIVAATRELPCARHVLRVHLDDVGSAETGSAFLFDAIDLWGTGCAL